MRHPMVFTMPAARSNARCLSVVALLVALLAGTTNPVAQAQSAAPAGSLAVGAVVDDAALSEGEVRKVDKDAQKLTLRHGPLVNLDMPAMTMVFRVGDPSLLDSVHVGDKVHFRAEKQDGQLVVTRLVP